MKYFISEEGGTGREFNTFSDFMDAISDIASAYEENGEDYFEIKVESECSGEMSLMKKIKRDTNEDLMNNVYELVKKNHCYDKAEKMMDYFLPETYKTMDLTDYKFDFCANVQFGVSEGIYIDCSIRGRFDENAPSDKMQVLHCGTFKTLGTSLEDMRIMGELAGSLIFFAKEYIDKNIEKYTPQKERKIQ